MYRRFAISRPLTERPKAGKERWIQRSYLRMSTQIAFLQVDRNGGFDLHRYQLVVWARVRAEILVKAAYCCRNGGRSRSDRPVALISGTTVQPIPHSNEEHVSRFHNEIFLIKRHHAAPTDDIEEFICLAMNVAGHESECHFCELFFTHASRSGQIAIAARPHSMTCQWST